MDIGIEQLSILIRVGALRFTGVEKRALLWEAHSVLNKFKDDRSQTKLFEREHKNYQLPSLRTEKLEHTFDEMEILGFPLSDPFYLLQEPPENNLLAKDFIHHLNRTIQVYAYLVARKHTRA